MTPIGPSKVSGIILHREFTKALDQLHDFTRNSAVATSRPAIAVIGTNYTGKTTLLRTFMQKSNQSSSSIGTIGPVLMVTMPCRPTVKAVAEHLLSELGVRSGTRLPEYKLSALVINELMHAHTRAVVVDQFQRSFDHRPRDPWLAEWLIEVVENSGTRLIVAMPTECYGPDKMSDRLIRRFVTPARLPTFDWSIHEHRDQFIRIVEELLPAGVDGMESRDSLALELHRLSGGVIGNLVAIVANVVQIGADDSRFSVEMRDLSESHRLTIGSQSDLLKPDRAGSLADLHFPRSEPRKRKPVPPTFGSR